MACGACARELPEGARFCPFCGTEVLARASEERRLVTVLFADLVGYTAWAERMDPERVRRLVDSAFERLIDDIIGHGGTVDKVVGDGILALFGAPTAHEDDADRAVRAAVAMQQSLAEFVVDQGVTEPVELRVGINTGEVIVGSVGTDDYTAMGDVVNVASRLQTSAPAGAVFVGDSTASLLSPRILVERVEDMDLRGREQTEVVWRVIGIGRAGRTRSHDVAFVGRRQQQRLLESVLAVVRHGQSAVVAVTGEAGSGKTRLISHVLERFDAPGSVVFAGQCLPYGEENVWAPLAGAMFGRLDGELLTSPQRLREASRALGEGLFGFAPDDPALGRVVEAVQYLGGFPSTLDEVPPAQAREMLFRLVIQALRRRSRIGPVVLFIDDLQWADALMIALLQRINHSLIDRPVLLITAQRDDAEIDWPPIGDHPTMTLKLDPFSMQEANELVTSVIGERPDDRLAGALYDRSGGNPLFLTELARLAAEGENDESLPGSLRVLIAARLDRLPPTARAILDNAAVLGTDSPVIALKQFATQLDQPFSEDDLDLLVEDGLLEVDDDWYHFRSDVVREVAYQTLTKVVRAERHAGVARVMWEMGGVPIDRIAHHAASAAELVAEVGAVEHVPEDISTRAVKVLDRAARRAIAVGAFNRALEHTTRALAIGTESPRRERSLLLLRARAATERREVAPARADAERVLELAIEAKSPRHEATARRTLGELAQISGDLIAARLELDRSIEIFRELDDEYELARSLSERGFVEVFGGSLKVAETVLAEAETIVDRVGDRRLGAWVREHQAWVAFLSGDAEDAERRLDTAAAVFEELGDRAGMSWARALRAYLFYFARDLEAAEKLALQVRAEAIELGERWAPAMMDSLIAAIRLWGGHFVEAEELSRRALEEFRQLGDRFGIIQALSPRIRALVALGRSAEARQGIEETLALTDAFGDLAFPTMAAAGTAAHLGLGERAVVLGETALEQITRMQAQDGEVRTTLALALCQTGRAEEALAMLLGVPVDSPYSMAVRALASALLGDGAAAIADGDAVWDDPGATYLDRVVAGLAAAAGRRSLGDHESAAGRLAQVRRVAEEAGDQVAISLAHRGSASLDGFPPDPAHDPLESGWQRVLQDLVRPSAAVS